MGIREVGQDLTGLANLSGLGQTMTFTRKLKPHEFNLWRNARPRLGQLDLELTERCNNNCLHCCINLPANDANARAREMDTAFVKDGHAHQADGDGGVVAEGVGRVGENREGGEVLCDEV